MATAKLTLGTLPSVDRPALAGIFPTLKGAGTVLLDVGANAECKPEHLKQFAIMGSIYSRSILGVRNPKVGLMSIGEEDVKGNELTRETLNLMRAAPINFIGNVEGRDIFTGDVDVIVSDGFTGNVILKTSEGLVEAIMALLKTELGQTILTQIGAMLSLNAFRSVKKRLDYSEFGGAPLLGCKQICVICHGSSNPKAIRNAIRVAREFYKGRLSERIESELSQMVAGNG
jgi:glycerol-3-phosphate acyltransferase PlsX